MFLTRNHCTAYAFCTPVSPLQQSLSMITICFSFRILYLLAICAIDRVTGHFTHTRKLFSFCSIPVGSKFAALHVVVFSFMLASSATVFGSCRRVFWEDYFWGLVWIHVILCDLASAADTEASCGLFLLFVFSSLLLLVLLFLVCGHAHTLEKQSLYRAPARVFRPAPPEYEGHSHPPHGSCVSS